MQQYHREATMLLCVYPCLHQPRADLIVFQLLRTCISSVQHNVYIHVLLLL